MDRRGFLLQAGLAVTAATVSRACRDDGPSHNAIASGDDWDKVRNQFNLSRDVIDLSAMFIASHPKPVRDAIEQHRQALDDSPTVYLRSSISRYEDELLQSAAEYLGASPRDIAVTDSISRRPGARVAANMKLHRASRWHQLTQLSRLL